MILPRLDGSASQNDINKSYRHSSRFIARAVAFAISQPEEVDINEILFRPTRQEL